MLTADERRRFEALTTQPELTRRTVGSVLRTNHAIAKVHCCVARRSSRGGAEVCAAAGGLALLAVGLAIADVLVAFSGYLALMTGCYSFTTRPRVKRRIASWDSAVTAALTNRRSRD